MKYTEQVKAQEVNKGATRVVDTDWRDEDNGLAQLTMSIVTIEV